MDLSKYKDNFYQKVELENGIAILYKDDKSNDVKYDLYDRFEKDKIIHTSSTFQNIDDLLNDLRTVSKN